MTNQHTPNDEETSVFPAIQPQPSAPRAPVPPSVMPPLTPVAAPPANPPAMPVYPPTAGYAPPATMPVQYPAYRQPPFESSGRAGLAALILIVLGLTEAVIALLGAIFAGTLRRAFGQLLRDQGFTVDAGSLTGTLTVIFLMLLLLGVLQVIAAGGILGHRRWGRWLGALLSLIGSGAGAWLVYRVMAADKTTLATLAVPLLVLMPYLISLLGLLFPGRHFRRGWPGR